MPDYIAEIETLREQVQLLMAEVRGLQAREAQVGTAKLARQNEVATSEDDIFDGDVGAFTLKSKSTNNVVEAVNRTGGTIFEEDVCLLIHTPYPGGDSRRYIALKVLDTGGGEDCGRFGLASAITGYAATGNFALRMVDGCLEWIEETPCEGGGS